MASSDLDRGCCRSRMDQPHAKGCALAYATSESGRFWLILHEPGCVPERKGPWPEAEIRSVLREFMAARAKAYIDVLREGPDGPSVSSGPETLQMLDGRSMAVGRRHNAATRAAHAEHHGAIAAERFCVQLAEARAAKTEAAHLTLAIWAHAVSDDASPNSDGALRLGGEVVVKASLVLRLREALAGLQLGKA